MKKVGLILGSILVLIALGIGGIAIFGQSREQATGVKVTTSSSKASSASSKSTSKTSQSRTSQETATTESSEMTTTSEQQETSTAASSGFSNLQAGDFTALAGTWSNGEGYSVQIGADGTTADGSKITLTNPVNNYLQGSIAGAVGGAGFIYLPAGVPYVVTDAEGKQLTIESDTSRERILISQSLPNEQSFYYKN